MRTYKFHNHQNYHFIKQVHDRHGAVALSFNDKESSVTLRDRCSGDPADIVGMTLFLMVCDLDEKRSAP